MAAKLDRAGATEIHTAAAADTVVARLGGDALTAIATDPTVTVATRDIAIHATGGTRGKTGYEPNTSYDTATTWSVLPPAWYTAGPLATVIPNAKGISVAIMDTGIAQHPDLGAATVVARADFVRDGNTSLDPGGHGTFVAGLIAANGGMTGIDPFASLVSLRVLDADGNGSLHNVVYAFDWLLRNRTTYNIRVLNISWGAPQATSYHADLLSVLAEAAWFDGITVIAAAGNDGGPVTVPASDPFVVAVGAYDDNNTYDYKDDVFAPFSSFGPTLDGFTKPDLLAPGVHVRSLRSDSATYLDPSGAPIGSSTDLYVHMTGTSASTAYVSGVALLVLAAHPDYTPTMVKGALLIGARTIFGAATKAVSPDKVTIGKPVKVNAHLQPSLALLIGLASTQQVYVNGVAWTGISWDGITWEDITWDSISWEGISWESISWEGLSWEAISWEEAVLTA